MGKKSSKKDIDLTKEVANEETEVKVDEETEVQTDTNLDNVESKEVEAENISVESTEVVEKPIEEVIELEKLTLASIVRLVNEKNNLTISQCSILSYGRVGKKISVKLKNGKELVI